MGREKRRGEEGKEEGGKEEEEGRGRGEGGGGEGGREEREPPFFVYLRLSLWQKR